MAVVLGIAAAAIGAGVAAYSASKQKKSTTTSKVEFPPETRRLFQDIELPLLSESLQEQSALLGPILGGFRTAGSLDEQTQAPIALSQAAAQRGAQDAGVTDLGPIFEGVGGLQPELLAALRGLALQRGQQVNAAIPPGYLPFLAPSNISTTQGAKPSTLDIAVAGAGGATSGFASGYGAGKE